MSKSNQFESPCYFLSAEEYTQDYLSLPEPQLACLFKLRSAYALKGSPLSEDDIDGLYPVYTPVHEKTLGKVLNKFFTKKGGVFIDIRIESQIEKRKEHQLNIEQLIEKEVQKRVARADALFLQKPRNAHKGVTLGHGDGNEVGLPNALRFGRVGAVGIDAAAVSRCTVRAFVGGRRVAVPRTARREHQQHARQKQA